MLLVVAKFQQLENKVESVLTKRREFRKVLRILGSSNKNNIEENPPRVRSLSSRRSTN